MATLSCALSPSSSLSPSISKFISDHPCLTMLQNHCSTMKDLKQIHAQVIKNGLALDTIAASHVLIFCAASSGDINYAYLVFTTMRNPNLYTCNTIIRGFSRSSTPQLAISLFIDMLYSEVQPTHLTYPLVFKAYAQLGAVHDGAQLHGRVVKLGREKHQFICNTIIYMYANSGLLSEARRVLDGHIGLGVVACDPMTIRLAKCGEIDQSERLFDDMPTRTSVTWISMINGYVRNGKLNEFNPSDASGYVLVSNVHAASNQFEEAIENRLLMKESLAEKEPGCSSIEVYGEVHEFLAGERLHPKNDSSFAL